MSPLGAETSMDIPPKNEEGLLLFFKNGGILCLILYCAYSVRVGQGSYSSRSNIGSHSLLHFVIIHMFRCVITFASCFITGKTEGWRTFPKYRAGLYMKLS
jgi:hypothetical protein